MFFSGSNLAPALWTLFKSKDSTNSSRLNNSFSVPSFQPNNARKLITASGKKPFSLYPEDIPSSVSQSNGNTGKPILSPSRLDNFPFPTGFIINGKCANSGASQPNALYSKTCRGIDGNHSSPRITCEVSIKWSSTIFAKWYVGIPSLLNKTLSSSRLVSNFTSPRMMSCKCKVSFTGVLKRIT